MNSLPRIIPVLLIQNEGLVKTIKFEKPTYLGDPINAVRIFNESEADELVIYDIDASKREKDINFQLIEEIAQEAFMPICYGGGIKDIESMRKLFRIGIEKISICSAATQNPNLIFQAAQEFGSQSIVVSADFYKQNEKYYLSSKGNSEHREVIPWKYALEMENLGAGELIINSINNDGTYSGYDVELVKSISKTVKIPVIASCGASSIVEMIEICQNHNLSGAAAGSLFVYFTSNKGILINYPMQEEIRKVYEFSL
jgi:cyclase